MKFIQENVARKEMSKNKYRAHYTLQSVSSTSGSQSSITDCIIESDSSFDSLNEYIKMKQAIKRNGNVILSAALVLSVSHRTYFSLNSAVAGQRT